MITRTGSGGPIPQVLGRYRAKTESGVVPDATKRWTGSRRSVRLLLLLSLLALSGWPVYAQSNLSVLSFGATPDGIMRTDGAMTAGSGVLTSASGTFTSADVGKYIQVIGAG